MSRQKPEYLAARLRRWRGDPATIEARKSGDTMPMIARRIPEHMIEPLARYFARQADVANLADAPHTTTKIGPDQRGTD